MPGRTEGPRACIVCAEKKPAAAFPDHLASPLCSHSINTCTQCTRDGILYSVQTAEEEAGGYGYNRYNISCLECPQIISLDVAQYYMDNEAFRKFEKATIQRVLALASATKASQIVWCPFCKDVGQTYAANQTILICHSCERLFCCRHTYRGQPNSVPWHPKHTCEEYDKSQDDPTFRSSAQIQQARQDALDQQSRDLSRQIEISNEDWELSLTRKNDEAKLRKIEKARLERERREEEERRRRAQEKREAARKAARDAENRASEGMIQQAFVRCPFCQQPVEKISGCMHIICKCGKHWNYRTGKAW